MSTHAAPERSASQEDAGTCAGCGMPLSGPYCSQCGERVLDHHQLSVWHFISHNLVHEFSHVDGKIARTLRYLFFRPGFLTEEYFAGRRLAYVNPVRLLLTAVIAFALLVHGSGFAVITIGKLRLSMLPPGIPETYSIQDTVTQLDLFGMLSGRLAKVRQHTEIEKEAAVERFHHELRNYSTALSFGNVLLLAGLLFLLFHRRRHYFLEHLVYSLHVACFVLFFSIVALNIFRVLFILGHGNLVKGTALAVMIITMFLEVVYLHRSMLRFYFEDDVRKRKGWGKAAWATRGAAVLVFFGNSAALTVVYFVGAAIALARI